MQLEAHLAILWIGSHHFHQPRKPQGIGKTEPVCVQALAYSHQNQRLHRMAFDDQCHWFSGSTCFDAYRFMVRFVHFLPQARQLK